MENLKSNLRYYLSKRNIIIFAVSFFVFPLLFLLFTNYRIESVSEPFVTSDINKLPDVKVAIIPGTVKMLKSGYVNKYFQYRIDAAVKLYEKGKVKHFLVSGDNSTKDYNEAEDMKVSLVERGVPDSIITLDYAGFDTYDSMIRAKKVFGQQKFIVVSQEFQNDRAVYIARSFGIEAYGYNAQDVRVSGGFKTKVREFFARGKAYAEVFFGVEPTFLGEKVELK